MTSGMDVRPAGMSSDEDDFDDDDYYCINISDKSKEVKQSKNLNEFLPKNEEDGLGNILDEADKTRVFHKAAENSDFEVMRKLIAEGISVDKSEINQWTPLMKACSVGNYEVVEFLLQNGSNPNHHKELFTPLMACCIPSYLSLESRVQCIRLLIQNGANVNATDKYKSTALITAATNGLEMIVAELLTVPNIDINAKDKNEWNALFHAVKNNDISIVKQLVNAGIDLDATTKKSNMTALNLAEMKNFSEIISILNPHTTPAVIDTVKYEADMAKDALQEFFNEFPDSAGLGGFSSEVRNIFLGLGLETLYDRLKINISLPDFLVISDLTKLGIKVEPIRHKILVQGIHRYHICPWKKSSLPSLKNDKQFSLEDYINFLSNVTKHLVILRATLNYTGIRINQRINRNIRIDKELLRFLTESYVEIQQMKKTLTNILNFVSEIKSAGELEADFVGLQKRNTPYSIPRHFWFVAGTFSVAAAFIYYKLK